MVYFIVTTDIYLFLVTCIFFNNEATGGRGLFVTPYVFLYKPTLCVFLFTHSGPKVYLGKLNKSQR